MQLILLTRQQVPFAETIKILIHCQKETQSLEEAREVSRALEENGLDSKENRTETSIDNRIGHSTGRVVIRKQIQSIIPKQEPLR